MINKKGFTLIELLAVILVLGIIALIAVPVVNNIIKASKKGAFTTTVENVLSAAENACELELLREEELTTTYTFTDGKVSPSLNIKGKLPTNGTISIDSNCKTAANLTNGTFVATKVFTEDNITVVEGATVTPIVYKDNTLNGTDPELETGMIPVLISDDGTVTVADIYSNWYSYSSKKWANVVTVTSSSRSNYINVDETYKSGTVITENDILTYLVWIPRYRYEIFNDGTNISVTATDSSNIQTINIVFENKNATTSTGNTDGDYLTHPAFTFGSEELNGFWVGKFETTGDVTTTTIKPNIASLRNMNVSEIFTTTRDMESSGNIYGIEATEIDTHLMKNIEWGAVAYLSHSIYGLNSNMRYNNSSDYITGCAASTEPVTSTTTAGYAGCENAYNTTNGYLASTTGNITGIYDMAGGAWEYVMGVVQDSTGTDAPLSGNSAGIDSGFNGLYGTTGSLTTGIAFPISKYFDLYDYGTTWKDITAYSRGYLGDATKEMGSFAQSTIDTDATSRYESSWYHDYAHFAYAGFPWVIRSGNWSSGAGAGIFTFTGSTGSASDYAFRVIMATTGL